MRTQPLFQSLMILIVVGGILVAGVTPLSAAEVGKVGFVDIERITQEAKFIRRILDTAEERLQERRDSLDLKQDDYTRLRGDVERKRAVLNDAEIDEMLRRSRRLRGEIEDEEFEINRTLRRIEKEQMEPAMERVLETIREVGRGEGFDLILRGEIVLYGSEAVDISGKVIGRLDAAPAPGKVVAPLKPGDGSSEDPKPDRELSISDDDEAASEPDAETP